MSMDVGKVLDFVFYVFLFDSSHPGLSPSSHCATMEKLTKFSNGFT